MKIAVLGAPGAGKTDFARSLSDQLKDTPFIVIDNYVEELRKLTGLEYGPLGNHIDDLQVVFKRREGELHWGKAANTITCGTMLDSTAHCFVRAEDRAYNPRELMLHSERLRTVAEMFGLVFTDTWDYDYAFYLSYRGEDPSSALIDGALIELLRSYAPPILSFKPEVKDEEKARIAAETIRTLEAQQFPATQERRVESGGEDGEDGGDSIVPMPDVPEQGRDSDDA